MVVVLAQDDSHQQQSAPIHDLFSARQNVQDQPLSALITDFFEWLETAWRLPFSSADQEKAPLPPLLTLAEELYTVEDLSLLYGYHKHAIHRILKRFHILSLNASKGRYAAIYSRQDLIPVINSWELQRLLQPLDQWWLRFFPFACKMCRSCHIYEHRPVAQQIYCKDNLSLWFLRSVFTTFLEEVCRLGSVTAWWHEHQADTWGRKTSSAWGIVLIYLLDRQLLHLSSDELVHLSPVCSKSVHDLTRLWRHRHPEEYEPFLQAMKAANYRSQSLHDQALRILSVLIFFKYGLPGVTELRRALSSEDIQQLCDQRRLVTTHIGWGIFLPFPLTADIRIGHAVLDDIRYSFWNHAAQHALRSKNQQWDKGPRYWKPFTVSIIEQALAAPLYENKQAILSRRPETERAVVNPWRIIHEGNLTGNSFTLLPEVIQKQVLTYLTYGYQEQQRTLTTLLVQAECLMRFFTWVRRQDKLMMYPSWTKEMAQAIFSRYASTACAGLKARSRQQRLTRLAHFFATLASLEYPVPAGYQLLYTLEKEGDWPHRFLPNEGVLYQSALRGIMLAREGF